MKKLDPKDVLITKDGHVMNDVETYEKEKNKNELLSKNLSEVEDFYRTSDISQESLIENAEAQFEEYKKKYKESQEIIYPKVTPLGMYVITTARLRTIEEAGMFLLEHEFSNEALQALTESVAERQHVVAVGRSCQDVKVGDEVAINLGDFIVVNNPNSVNRSEARSVPSDMIEGRYYLVIGERNCKYIYDK